MRITNRSRADKYAVRTWQLAIGCTLGVLLGACGAPTEPKVSEPVAKVTQPANVDLTPLADSRVWPQQQSPIAVDPELEERIGTLLASMSIEEKVGQIVQGDLGSVTPEDLLTYRLGSVLAGGNSDPGAQYNASPKQWLELADAFYQASMDTSHGGKAIPVLLGIDAVHGHNNVVGATLFPHNIALGAVNDPELIRQIAAASASELRATGFDWTFAPTVTVPRDDRWGRTYEGYSEDPALVARYATAVVEGLQGKVGSETFLDSTRVLASAKHFIGDGGTTGGKDKGNTEVAEAELRDVHGAGHMQALLAGTQTVMASFSSWNGQKMHGNRSLLTEVLKERLGFDGFVVGDWNGHGEVPGCSNESCPAALMAGVDMFMAPDTWRAVYDNTVKQVQSGEISMERLDDAVRRILRVKFRLGLFDAGPPSKRALGRQFELLGSVEHRALARDAVRRSLVLLKNDGGLLPLNPKSRVLVAGDAANDIGKQSGGWTLSWQGTGNKATDFPNAQSIWAGIEAVVGAADGVAELSAEGSYATKPDFAIVVFGEEPYAEFIGDIATLAYQPGKERDLALLKRLQAEGIPVVAVFLSGRPLWMNREINASTAFVAAWLPGSEGAGVADLLFAQPQGAPSYDFVGKLPFSWPRSVVQTPLNVGQPDYDPQFAVGYGLRYADSQPLGKLSEESGAAHADAQPGVYFAQGRVAAGWRLMAADAGGAESEVERVPSGEQFKHFEVSAADHAAQEDARRLQWRGTGTARVWLQTGEPQDLSRESNAGALLVMSMNWAAEPAEPLTLSLGCGEGCSASVPLQHRMTQESIGRWSLIGVPLRCFVEAGADLSQTRRLFVLEGKSSLALSVSGIALGSAADTVIDCPK